MARTTPVNSGYSIINGNATGSNAAYVDVWLEWKQLSKDTSGNTSQVRVLLYAACTKSSSTSWSAAENFGYVGYNGGNRQYRSTTYNFANNAANCFGDHTFTVAHDSDGTKSITLEGAWSTSHSTYISGGSVSGDVTLEAISRASAFDTITGTTLGDIMRININRNSNAFTHTVWYEGPEGWSDGFAGGSYIDIVLPIGLARLSKTAQIDLLLCLRTLNGTQQVGEDVYQTVRVTVPENAETKPTVTMTLAAVDDYKGLYLQGRTKLQGTLEAEGKYGATIESLTMKVDSRTYIEPWLSNALNTPGVLPVIATAVDSRGFTGTAELTVEVLAYFRPMLTATAYRCLADGTAAEDGEFLKIRASAKYAPVEGSYSFIFYRYKSEGGEYSDLLRLSGGKTTALTVDTGALLEGQLLKENAYTVQILAIDSVGGEPGGTVSTVAIPSEAVFRHKRAGGKGLGLGGYCDQDDLLDVYWDIRGRKAINGMYIRRVPRNTGSDTFSIQTKYSIDPDAFSTWQTFLIFGISSSVVIHGMLGMSSAGSVRWTGQGNITGALDSNNGYLGVTLPASRTDPLMVISADPFEIVEE